jgi:beta-galactosidase
LFNATHRANLRTAIVTLFIASLLAGVPLPAQTKTVRIDASAAAPTPQPVQAQLGTARNPNGEVIGVNSQYLTLDGKPWLPVMGEFHFSRYPAARWEEEILKMKAAGVQIISTYVIWIHHEEHQGQFDWQGQRDLRRFTELCGKHGMYVYPRIGPWAHAEVRNGGLPDWVLKQGPVRQNDPLYLAAVDTFYQQIAAQLKGQLWKDGGPVIGIQIENEYRDTGPGKGSEHIRTLKQMAVKAGLDVPLYTVTGWDGAAIPLDAVLPVFGGYPDAPWDGSSKKLPPNEIYAFRFDNRAAGSMGAIGGKGQNASSTYAGTPFLTAEIGDGIEDTYFRRPVVSNDDIAAILPVVLGSGANLLGYYMFHGGRNPEGDGITLQESQRTGYPTDVPVKSYDFQAPLGEFGQERPSLRKMKLVHYFLEDFGATLAPMTPHRPDTLPADPADLSIPRVSARTLGNQGFVFFNNHVRGAAMPALKAFQIELDLPSGVQHIPEHPIALPADSYGIWPVNLPVGAQTLRYSTAQLFKRITLNGKTCFLFFAIDGLPAEFAFAKIAAIPQLPTGFTQTSNANGSLVHAAPGTSGRLTLQDGTTLVLFTESAAEQLWHGDTANTLLSSTADTYADHNEWTLESLSIPTFRYGLLNANLIPQSALSADAVERPLYLEAAHRLQNPPATDALFTWHTADVPRVDLQAKVIPIAPAGKRAPLEFGPALSWRPTRIPFAPEDKDFATAAQWEIHLPALPASSDSISDVLLRIRYHGDVARLSENGKLLDDNFWNGIPWEIGLGELPGLLPQASTPSQAPSQTPPQTTPQTTPLQLSILPLPAGAPMYFEAIQPRSASGDVPAQLDGVQLLPQYRIRIHTTPQE